MATARKGRPPKSESRQATSPTTTHFSPAALPVSKKRKVVEETVDDVPDWTAMRGAKLGHPKPEHLIRDAKTYKVGLWQPQH
jgi:hypothetical protein